MGANNESGGSSDRKQGKENYEKKLNAIIIVTPSPSTLRILGTIGEHRVLILVDSGSTHKFLNLAHFKKIKGVVDCSNGI